MNSINLNIIKKIFIYSAIIGIIGAIVSVFHIFMPIITLFILPFLGAILPIVLLIYKDNFSSDENKSYLILGAVSGLCIAFSFQLIFIPLIFVCTLVNKTYYDYGIKYLNPFLFVLFFVIISVVFICTNAVCGLFTGIVYNFIKSKKNG